MDPLLVTYAILAVGVAAILSIISGTRQKLVGFAMAVWILTGSILNTDDFSISFSRDAGFLLPLNRILLIFLGLKLLADQPWRASIARTELEKPKFERYLKWFFAGALIILIFHSFSVLSFKDVIVTYSGWIMFPLFYVILSRDGDDELRNLVFRCLLIVAVVSTVVGVIQFFVDSTFLRVGVERGAAFEGRLRSNGIFLTEYDQSYTLVVCIIITLITVRNILARIALQAICLIGIVFTFHRMSWGIVACILLAHYLRNVKHKLRIAAVALLIVAIGVTVALNLSSIDPSGVVMEFVYNRLLDNTATIRLKIDAIALSRIPSVWPVGIGSLKTSTYYYDLLETGIKEYASGESGGIHNLFINMAYFYGVPLVAIFTVFLVSTIRYFNEMLKKKGNFYFIPLSTIVMFIIANTTNWFYFSAYFSLLVAVILGVSVIPLAQQRLLVEDLV